jgi:hypothetical protein
MAQYIQKPLCPKSRIYDDAHFSVEGRSLFKWEARIESKGTLIADSLLKWAMDMAYLDLQAAPGLRLDTALTKMQNRILQVHDYEFLVLAVGTNSVRSKNVQEMKQMLANIIGYVNYVSPYCTIGVASILPCPQDNSEIWDGHRRQVNYAMKQYCQGPWQGRVSFLKTWKCVEDDEDKPLLGLYANDRLHFKNAGILKLKNHFEGAFAHLMDVKYRTE